MLYVMLCICYMLYVYTCVFVYVYMTFHDNDTNYVMAKYVMTYNMTYDI